jgi:hypothetical protein
MCKNGSKKFALQSPLLRDLGAFDGLNFHVFKQVMGFSAEPKLESWVAR